MKKQKNFWCPVCGDKRATLLPLPEMYGESARRYGFPYFGQGEMTSHVTYACRNCGASDRERLYALWLDQEIESGFLEKNYRLIHFAPEAALSKRIRTLQIFEYTTADFSMSHVDHRVDLMSMPYAEASFDFFICSHVLEHVESDDKAIRELYRVTKPGGVGILMVPIIVGLENTQYDSSVIDSSERWRRYGQGDHLRLYAHDDYISKIRQNGFDIDELSIRYFGERAFDLLGLKSSSILYIVKKPINGTVNNEN